MSAKAERMFCGIAGFHVSTLQIQMKGFSYVDFSYFLLGYLCFLLLCALSWILLTVIMALESAEVSDWSNYFYNSFLVHAT